MSQSLGLPANRDRALRLTRVLLVSLAMLFVTWFTVGVFNVRWSTDLFRFDDASIMQLSAIAAYLLANTLFILTMATNGTDRYRAVFFILVAVTFPIGFIADLFEMRGHLMTATFEDMITGQVPFCHIVIPQTIIPLLLKRTVVFPGTLMGSAHSIGSMIVLWIAVSVGIGRGWCSWTCFYGGWEDGFSRLAKRPRIRHVPSVLRYAPYAVLAAVVLSSLVYVVPTYCMWLCPFKSVSEFVQVLSPVNIIQTVLFIALFATLVVVFPFLTKKRTQCSYFCPFGAMQGFVDKINVFDVRVDSARCTSCKKCISNCPTSSITEASLSRGRTESTCVKCGKCMDLCPRKAISFHIKGTHVGGASGTVARTSFLFLSYVIIASMGGGMVASGVYRTLLLVTTGSILR